MKFLRILIINILILITIYGIGDFCCYKYICYKYISSKQIKFFPQYYSDYVIEFPPSFKYPENLDKYTKPPILVLGCSYVQGQGLEEKDNITSRITKDTNRFAYNYGFAGFGPSYTLTMLMAEEQFPHIEKPEKILYVYMFHHLQRWNKWQYYNVLKELNLIPFQKYNFLDKYSHIYQYIRNVQIDKYYNEDKDFTKRSELFFNIMKKIKEQSDKLFPNTEFYFLIYSDINYDLSHGIIYSICQENDVENMFKIMYSKEFKERLEALGMKVITTEELIGRKMDKTSDRIPNDISRPHPSNSAWNEIMPKLEKALDL